MNMEAKKSALLETVARQPLMKTHWEGLLHAIVNFKVCELVPGTHWIGGWVDPRASLDNMEKINSWTYQDSNSEPSVIQLAASRYTNYAIPGHTIIGTMPSKGLQSTLWWSIASILLVECTSVAHWLSSTDAILLMAMTSIHFYVTIYGQTKHVLHVRACFTFTTVTPGQRIILMLSMNKGIKYASVSASQFGLESSDIVMGSYLLPDRLPAQWCCDMSTQCQATSQ
jgi:hypothetical protein